MSNFELLSLPNTSDERGTLTVLQNILPFEVVRMFWITGADGYTRGGHRHHVTRQALMSINGIVTIYMNDGIHAASIKLDSPTQCLIVEPEDWHTMTFGVGAVLLVLASHEYDRTDYIDDQYITI